MSEAARIDHSKKKPSHLAYLVKDKEKGGQWIEIGCAWSTKDGDGYVIRLDAIPTDGRVVLRVNKNEWGQR